jgi:hypothetical protein
MQLRVRTVGAAHMTPGHNVHHGSRAAQYIGKIVIACTEHNFQSRESLLDGGERHGRRTHALAASSATVSV